MKNLGLFILVCINLVYGQSNYNCNFGRKPNDVNYNLIVSNRSYFNLEASIYNKASSIIFRNFKDESDSLDNWLNRLSVLKQIECLYFENCDLMLSEFSFEKYPNLKKLVVGKKSIYLIDQLCYQLKFNQIEELCFQYCLSEDVLSADSLHLVSSLKTINISSSNKFKDVSNSFQLAIKSNTNTNIIKINSFEDKVKTDKILSVNKKVLSDSDKNQLQRKANELFLCLKQPIPGIIINDTIYKLNSFETREFYYSSGTKLLIDKNSFLTANGTTYNGPVKLFYREFRNPVEIMLSGIPMTTNFDNQEILFKSGGMYQIQAFDNNNNLLQAKTDTAIRLNFVLSDTSANFKFYSLNSNGNWVTIRNKLAITSPTTNNTVIPKSVLVYRAELSKISRYKADTTKYNERFNDPTYLNVFRKDNLYKDSLPNFSKSSPYFTSNVGRKSVHAKSIFKIRYYATTKDKQVVFKIIPSKKDMVIPNYIRCLVNKSILYTGNLTKEEFKKKFNRNLLCWDLRPLAQGNSLSFKIKTNDGFEEISGEVIKLNEDKTYEIYKSAGKVLNQRVSRLLSLNEKRFDNGRKKYGYETGRYSYKYQNNRNKRFTVSVTKEEAYALAKKYMNTKENNMTLTEFVKYASTFPIQFSSRNAMLENSLAGNALIASGLGIKNIDAYLHKNLMDEIFVKYLNHNDSDSISYQTIVMLYKNINTSYPLNTHNEESFHGYYLKNSPNYIVRMNKTTMQVEKPQEFNFSKNIEIIYKNEYNLEGKNSAEITNLILD